MPEPVLSHMAQCAAPKKRKLIVVRKCNDPVQVKPPLSEEEIEAAAKAAAKEQLSRAIRYKNLAIDCMACSNIVGIKALLGTLETWQPSASTLRASGLPIIFHDIKFWEDAKVFDRASALLSKFRKVMQDDRPSERGKPLTPFLSLSQLQFRQAIDRMAAFMRSGSTTEAVKGIFLKLAYHIVMNGFTMPQALEGLRMESCQVFTSSMLEETILSQAITTGTAMAVASRQKLMLARTAEFKATLDSELMVNAHAITQHWNQRHIQVNSCKVQQAFKALGVDFKKMLPRQVVGQLALASSQGKEVFEACAERARHVTLFRNQGSLASLRSGIRLWHKFAVLVLHYNENLSAPPRCSKDVLYWLGCFSHHGTAMNYMGYLKNFCEVENLSMKWLDNSVLAWRKGATKLKLINGFKHTSKRVLFTWEWIKKLLATFDEQRMARRSLFVLLCWTFLLRPLSEACPMLAGDERDTCSLPDDKHSGIWIDRQGRVNLRLLKWKHRPRGSHMQRGHICRGLRHKAYCCLPCRLPITLSRVKYGEALFTENPAQMMQAIKAHSRSLSYNAEGLTWKSFRAGHATHLAVCGCDIKVIASAGEWRSRAFLDNIDGDKVDEVAFLNTTMNQSDEEDEVDAALAEGRSSCTLGVPVGSDE